MAEYPTFESLVERARAFLIRARVTRGIPTSTANKLLAKGGADDLLIRMVATLVTGGYGAAIALEDQQLPDTATQEHLDRICSVFGLTRSAGSKATGSIVLDCTGTVSISSGTQLTAATSGRTYQVTSNYASAVDGDLIAVQCTTVGTSGDLPASAVLTWTSPPSGVASTALVDTDGITGGATQDTDSSLRRKLLRLLREPQNGGSWAHVKQWIEDADDNVEAAYVYPAAQGPATVHAAFTVAGSADNGYQRAASSALVAAVVAAVLEDYPEHSELVLTTVAHADLTLCLRATLPEPAIAGGVGGGWVDRGSGSGVTRWPPVLGTGLPVKITSITSTSQVTVNATTAPVIGASLDVWDSTEREFVRTRITAYSGSSGAYVLTLDTPLPNVTTNDYVSPAMEYAGEYARILQEQIALYGPGEKTSDATILARAYRHPRSSEESPSGVDTKILASVQTERQEVTGLRFSAINDSASFTLPVEPSVPGTVTSPPNVWRLKRLAIYA